MESETTAGGGAAGNAANELDICLAKCTNPLMEISDEMIDQLCQLSCSQSNGPFTTLRFLAYKAQSPQQCEAIHALHILERVVKVGGFRIADEVGKFRFLNEIIKIVSPKYLAHRTSNCVRQRIVELIFLWSMEFKELPKIFEAYQMLKVQKIITEDPVYVLENFRPPTPPEPRPKDQIFDNENTVQTLRTLLDSGRPDQLQTANRLIKNLAMKAESRIQFRATFNTELESIQNCAQLLYDMLAQCNLGLRIDPIQKLILDKGANDEDFQLMRELFANCEKSRLKLFKFANQINSDNSDQSGVGGGGGPGNSQESEELNRLLSVAELLTSAINSCKRYFALLNNPRLAITTTSTSVSGAAFTMQTLAGNQSQTTVLPPANQEEPRLLDLNSSPLLSSNSLHRVFSDSLELDIAGNLSEQNSTDHQMVDLMMMVGNSGSISSSSSSSANNGLSSTNSTSNNPRSGEPAKFKSAVDELNALSDLLVKQHLSQSSSDSTSATISMTTAGNTQTTSPPTLHQLQQQKQKLLQKLSHSGNNNNQSVEESEEQQQQQSTTELVDGRPTSVSSNGSAATTTTTTSTTCLSDLLSNCCVSYDSIIPGTIPEHQIPLLLFNDNRLMITLHFTGNRPHPQILVFLLTFTNYNTVAVSKIQFLAAVPKNMKVKLQPQTGTTLPGLSPTLTNKSSGPTTTNVTTNLPKMFITQLMLVAFNDPIANCPNGPNTNPTSTISSSSSAVPGPSLSHSHSHSSSQSSLSSSSSPDPPCTNTITDTNECGTSTSTASSAHHQMAEVIICRKFRLKFKFSYLLHDTTTTTGDTSATPHEHVSYFDCNLDF